MPIWFQSYQIIMIPIPAPIPLGLISFLIPISGFTKIYDSNSNSDSSSKWFRFQCFPKNLIPILISIPASCDSNSNSRFQYTRLWFRFWFRNLILIPKSFTTMKDILWWFFNFIFWHHPWNLSCTRSAFELINISVRYRSLLATKWVCCTLFDIYQYSEEVCCPMPETN